MAEELNFEKYNGERVPMTLNKDLADRLQLVRAYCDTVDTITDAQKEIVLQAIDNGTFIDMALEAFIDGMFGIDRDEDFPR